MPSDSLSTQAFLISRVYFQQSCHFSRNPQQLSWSSTSQREKAYAREELNIQENTLLLPQSSVQNRAYFQGLTVNAKQCTWVNWNCGGVRSTIIWQFQCCSIIHTIQQGECQDTLSWTKQHGTLWQCTASRGWHIQFVSQCGYMFYFSNLNQNWNIIWAAFLTTDEILQWSLGDNWWICRN